MYAPHNKGLNHAYLVNAYKLWIPALLLWASHLGKSCFVPPPRQPKSSPRRSSLETLGYKTRRADSLRKYARRDLSVPAKASQQTQHTARQRITSFHPVCGRSLKRRPKMVDILLPSFARAVAGPQWSARHVPFRLVP